MAKILWSGLWLILLISIVNGQTNVPKSQTIKEVTLCSVEVNPDLYLEQQLDVEAIYVVGFEMGWLENSCSRNIHKDNRFAIKYQFDEAHEEKTNPAVLRRMNKILRTKQQPRKVKGRFTILVSKYKKKNENDIQYEYEITVLKVLSASRLKD